MSVVNVWVGATTPSTATIVAKVTGSAARLAVADNPGLTSSTFFGPVAPTAQGIVRLTASGLTSDTRYYFAVEDDGMLDATFPGQFRTHPELGQPATFTIGMGTCAGAGSSFPGVGDVLAGDRLSNHPLFDTIRQKALAEDWLLFIHGGDMHYYDIGSGTFVPNHDLTTYRRAYDDVLLQSRQHALYRNVPVAYIYDDHDFGPNNSDSSAPGRDNCVQVYQERVPHYPRGTADLNRPNHQAFQIGRVLFVMWDTRADRDPQADPDGPGKTMLGEDQKEWFKGLLESASARFLVLVNPGAWDHENVSGWADYAYERDELIAAMAVPGGDPAKNWLSRMCLIQGDHHSLGISYHNVRGGFPLFQFAPIDSGPSNFEAWRDVSIPTRGQFGALTIDDTGTGLVVTARGWNGTAEVMRYSFVVPEDDELPATVQQAHNPLYAATNTTFGIQTTSGEYRDCGVVFVAPPSGRVAIHWSGGVRNLGPGGGALAYLSPEVRAGAVVGSGSVVLAAVDRRTVRTNLAEAHTVRAGASHLLTGLAAGTTYNARLLHRVTSQTGEFFQRSLIVEPVP